MACPVLFAQLLLAPVLVDYLHQHPRVQVDLEACGHQTDVVAGGFDIAFRVRQSMKDSSLVACSFGMDPQILVASPALLQHQARPRDPNDLARIASVSVVGTEGRHFWTLIAPDGTSHQIEHHPRLVSDDLHVLYQAVIGGVGMAQLPHWLCREPIARGQLLQLLPAYALPPGNVHAVYPSRHGHTSAVRSFLDFVARELPQVLQRAQQDSPDARLLEPEPALP